MAAWSPEDLVDVLAKMQDRGRRRNAPVALSDFVKKMEPEFGHDQPAANAQLRLVCPEVDARGLRRYRLVRPAEVLG